MSVGGGGGACRTCIGPTHFCHRLSMAAPLSLPSSMACGFVAAGQHIRLLILQSTHTTILLICKSTHFLLYYQYMPINTYTTILLVYVNQYTIILLICQRTHTLLYYLYASQHISNTYTTSICQHTYYWYANY